MKQNPLIAGFRRGRSRATPVTTAVMTCLAISWAWVGLGSATATTAKPSFHGWWLEGAAAKASAGSTIASVKADAARTGSQVLLLYAHQVQNVYIDVGDASFSPGDYFMFVQQLRYSQGGAVVGRKAARCTIGRAPTSVTAPCRSLARARSPPTRVASPIGTTAPRSPGVLVSTRGWRPVQCRRPGRK